MIALTVQQIADAIGGLIHLCDADTSDRVVRGAVDTDSRLIGEDGIFFAKPGEVTDGHRFVADACQRGATIAVVEHRVDESVTQIVVDDVVVALAALAQFCVQRVRVAGDLRIVGITGSNGKTTTKNFLAHILHSHAETVWPRASFNNEVGAPMTMLKITEATRYLVLELGAGGPGDIVRLARLAPPDISVVLMVGMAHAGGFGSIEQTYATKSELIQQSAPGSVAVLNRDDPWVRRMATVAEHRGMSVWWFGSTTECDVYATDIAVSASGTSCTVVRGDTQRAVRLSIIGAHHVMNALAALSAALLLGVDQDDAVASLESFDQNDPGRMQILGSEDIRIINDAYNASPDSMAAALRTMAQITVPPERTIAVLGAMSELGQYSTQEHERIGELAVRLGIDKIIVIGQDARLIYHSAVREGSWSGEALFFTDADGAYDYLQGELRPGDRVLVKSSHAAGLHTLGERLGERYS